MELKNNTTNKTTEVSFIDIRNQRNSNWLTSNFVFDAEKGNFYCIKKRNYYSKSIFDSKNNQFLNSF